MAPVTDATTATERGNRKELLFVPWVVVSAWCTWLMWAFPGGEVIPYHAVWIGFALAYGFEPWPLRRTTAALAVFTVVPGAILVSRASNGTIAWEELGEIPLMLLLGILVVWHVQRRQQATTAMALLAQREVAAAEQRARLARMTSHEMRTPLTIASGYVDLLLDQEQEQERRADLEVVRDELGRLSRAGSRLLRMIRLQDLLQRSAVDLDALLQETAQRWAAVTHRDWVVESRGGTFEASAERIRACLDTLIENAVRYTTEGDTVRLVSRQHDGSLLLGVADSGPGLAPDQAIHINRAGHARLREPMGLGEPDPRSQTGLGLGIVREIVEARHGRVLAGRSREGGALVAMVLPLVAGDEGDAPGQSSPGRRHQLAI